MKLRNTFVRGRRKQLVRIFLFCLTATFLGLFLLNNWNSRPMPEAIPENFSFVFQYGVEGKNQIDTAKGLFIKDMVVDPPVTTVLKFTNTEMDEIYSKMRKIEITNYPTYFEILKNVGKTPFETFNIQISYNGSLKKIKWINCSFDNRKKAEELKLLFRRIEEIIMNHEEYKKLPEPRAGYA